MGWALIKVAALVQRLKCRNVACSYGVFIWGKHGRCFGYGVYLFWSVYSVPGWKVSRSLLRLWADLDLSSEVVAGDTDQVVAVV